MKYGFYCKRCGYSFLSDDKMAVASAKKAHGLRRFGKKQCPLVKTDRGTLVRPQLIK